MSPWTSRIISSPSMSSRRRDLPPRRIPHERGSPRGRTVIPWSIRIREQREGHDASSQRRRLACRARPAGACGFPGRECAHVAGRPGDRRRRRWQCDGRPPSLGRSDDGSRPGRNDAARCGRHPLACVAIAALYRNGAGRDALGRARRRPVAGGDRARLGAEPQLLVCGVAAGLQLRGRRVLAAGAVAAGRRRS